MHGLLFGLETELAFSATSKTPAQSQLFREQMIPRLFELAETRFCSLPDLDTSGMFLENGSRFYLDTGQHPEFCTPECRTPEELVRWQLAGERMLAGLTAELEKENPESRVSLFRCNVDYSGLQSVWGCHESYLYKKHGRKMPHHLVPHLVSRIIYTGAGGFDNTASNVSFVLSPRVPHLKHSIGPSNSGGRGIYHAKNEPLSRGGYSRLHLMCGESLSSQLSNYLKVGTTALVVRLIDAGVSTADKLEFEAPLESMRKFTSDPSCRSPQRLKDGRRLTAVEVQMEYLEMVEQQIGAAFMPEWTAEVCARWREVLEALTSNPESLSTRLDWAIKQAILREYTGDRIADLGRIDFGTPEAAEICEIDMCFGELGERGVFNALDRAGALEHRIPELGSIENAISAAPSGGRAAARGRAIRSLHGSTTSHKATWEGVVDFETGRTLQMSNPFDSAPRWVNREDAAGSRGRTATLDFSPNHSGRNVERGIELYVRMNIPRAIAEFKRAIRMASANRDLDGEALARFWCATAHTEMGNISALQEMVAPALSQVTRLHSAETRIRLWTRYAISLIERPARLNQIESTLGRCREALTPDRMAGQSRINQIQGRLLAVRGRYREAIEITERAIDEGNRDSIAFATSSYWHRIITYCLRDRDLEGAERHLAEWKREGIDTGRDLYVRGLIACSESDIACADGRPNDGLAVARPMLEHIPQSRNIRWCLSVRRAAVNSAIAVGDLEWARPILDEMLKYRDLPVSHVALESHRLDAAYHLAAARRTGSIDDPLENLGSFESETETSGYAEELRKFGQAYRRARAHARNLDDRLQTDCHSSELATSIGGIAVPR